MYVTKGGGDTYPSEAFEMHAENGWHVGNELALCGRSVQLASTTEPPAGVTGSEKKEGFELYVDASHNCRNCR